MAILVVTALAGSVAWAGPVRAGTFDDVPAGVWFETPVEWLVSVGITNGTSDTTFSPNDFVNRGQMAAFLARYGEYLGGSPEAGFSDVPDGAFYDAPVDWLVERGITQGTSATTYSPGANVTRAQMAAFLWRFAGRMPSDVATPFTDVPDGAWYAEAVSWLLENGITQGTSATTFSPGANVTRAQMAAFLWRLAGRPDPGDPGQNRVASLPIAATGGQFSAGDVLVTIDGLTDDGFVKVVTGEGGGQLASLDGAVSDDVEITISQAEADGPITVTVPIETVDLDDVELIVYVLDGNGQWEALAIDVTTKVVDGQMFATFTLPAATSLAPSGWSLFAAGDFERIVARVATRDLPPPTTTSSTTTTTTTTTVAPDPLTIDVSALPAFATEGAALVGGGRPTAEGGAGGYTFSAPDLPAGLSMADDGAITGTPTVDGRFYVTVEVEDSAGATTSTIHVLDVAAADQEGRFEIYPDSTASLSYPAITPDGRFMALDTGDTLAGEDEVDIIDRDADETVASFTARGFAYPSGVVHLSDDGRYATYYSEGAVYQRDLVNDAVTVVASDAWWFGVAASDDGSVVAFYSNVGELQTPVDPLGDAAGPYVWDRSTGTFERIAAGLGTPAPSATSMSSDGRSI
ncbi:MAG: S-layer homology domain-containing protein, partial [Actinomycetota bacterium]